LTYKILAEIKTNAELLVRTSSKFADIQSLSYTGNLFEIGTKAHDTITVTELKNTLATLLHELYEQYITELFVS